MVGMKPNRCMVSHEKNGQFRVTIPRGVAEGAGLKKGEVLFVELTSYGDIRMCRCDADGKLLLPCDYGGR